jgi:hypothetical protein
MRNEITNIVVIFVLPFQLVPVSRLLIGILEHSLSLTVRRRLQTQPDGSPRNSPNSTEMRTSHPGLSFLVALGPSGKRL